MSVKKAKPRPHAAAYVRVSSASQSGHMQRAAIRQACDARGDVILTEAWYEESRSAKTLTRPALDRLRQDVREGRVRKLYVWKLDRLTRSGISDTFKLIEEFRSHGCELVLLADAFDLTGPTADVVMAVLSFAAQMEWLAITERRAAARERVLADGGTWGRPLRMDDGLVARAVALSQRGKSIRAIAAQLQTPRATIARALARRLKSTPEKARPRGREKPAARGPMPPPSR